MNNAPTLADAMSWATEAHKGQYDRSGVAYILHPLRIMHRMNTRTEQIVGVLHDIIEDTPITFKGLQEKGYSQEVIDALDHLTRQEGEKYDDFIKRCRKNSIALKVKIADLEDNMDIRRLDKVTESDLDRLNRYLVAWKYLTCIPEA
jgi:(p)ppGpp synthase/HD superfamily hydrolase